MQSAYIPLFGTNDVRVGIHGVFTIMPALLFGPWYGAAASGLGDLLGHFMRPSGGWLWQITVIMTLGGFMRGWVWRLLKSRSPIGTRGVVAVMTFAFIVFGAISMVQLRQDGITRQFYDNVAEPSAVETHDMSYIGRLVISRTQNTSDPAHFIRSRFVEVTFAPLGVGLLGLILLGVDIYLSKGLRKDDENKVSQKDEAATYNGDKRHRLISKLTGPWNGSVMSLALTIIVVSLMINTANSWLFWAVTVPAWRAFPFMYIWLPRAVIALLNSVVNVFIAVLLLRICYRLPYLKSLMD